MNRKQKLADVVARVLTVVNHVVPRGRHVFVHGSPGSEGNIVEIVRALIRETDREVVWAEAPSREYLQAIGIPQLERLKTLRALYSLPAVWSFLTAAHVFHTHGLYGNPVPPRRRPVTNLWHGDSIKGGDLFPHRTLRGPSSTYLVSSSKKLGERKIERARLPSSSLLLIGNPRVDQFRAPATDEQLELLGLPPSTPFVVWMPTFRVAKAKDGSVAWSNTADPSGDAKLSTQIQPFVDELHSRGLAFVVKPHRLDAASRDVAGAYMIDEGLLEAHGVPLYSVLARAAGLVSDYSSTWVDFLALDRPIAFFTPDLADFSASRGYYPSNVFEFLPGPQLTEDGGTEQMINDLLSPSSAGRTQRDVCKRFLGYQETENIASRILQAVGLLQQ